MTISAELNSDTAREQVAQMTGALDRGDVDTYLQPFAEDSRFRFANQDPVKGRNNIRDAVAGAVAALGGTRHAIVDVWYQSDTIIAEFDIDLGVDTGKPVTLPCVSVIRLRDGLVVDFRINMDASPAFSGSGPS